MRVWGGLALIALVVLAGGSRAQESEEPQASRLKPGKGRDVVASLCTACHTAEIIVASRMSRKTWDTTITWMQETQGLGPLEPELRETILDYLEKTQGLSEDDAGADGRSSPWAYPLYRPNPIW